MNSWKTNPIMLASTGVLCGVVLIQLFAAQIDAQRSTSQWQTLSGDAPRVIARGGFSGLFPDSSLEAYKFAISTSVAGTVLWCDVQLTKDGVCICFPDLDLANVSNIQDVYPNHQNSYLVNGVPTQGWFTIDFSLRDLKKVSLIRGISSGSAQFGDLFNNYAISTVQNVATQMKPEGFWLNVQHDAFYAQQNLSMSSFLLSVSNVSIDYISSPEVDFFRKIAGRFRRNGPNFVFHSLGLKDLEPMTNQTYESILSNLTFVKTFASGILVPKSYILPLDNMQYLLPLTSLVQDAHKAGLEVYVSGFANDVDIANDYSFDPVSEYLSFMDTGAFSVDGVLSDFSITASASVGTYNCFFYQMVLPQWIFLLYQKMVRVGIILNVQTWHMRRLSMMVLMLLIAQSKFLAMVYEFVSQAYEFLSDATVEINTYITGVGINGTITEFPFTAARYRRNRCLGRKEIPSFMSHVQPGDLLKISGPTVVPPAPSEAPVFIDDDVTEPPLPPVIAKAPNSTPLTLTRQKKLLQKFRIVSGAVVGVVLFLVLLTLFLYFLWKRETRLKHRNLMALIPLEHYTYAQVKRITKSFAEVVGRGGFGIVYRGTLGDGRMVAVKVLKDSKGNGEVFINEVASMNRTSHLSIVSLLGFCSEGSKRAIIYEFLRNGSLDKFISHNCSVNMDWNALYRIALGVARGLEYLHHSCQTRIVHFDIKPQNVLLDDNFCPKVSDFGLAKLCEKKESIFSLLDTRGTVGYIAPEMISRVYGNVSHKSDVYSYGMLVLEIIGARNKEKATQASGSNTSSIYFPEWVYRGLESGKPRSHIENGINNEDELAKKMTLVGLWCIQPSPVDRPPMNRVVEMMEGSLDDLEVPPRPVFQIPAMPLQESSTFLEDISV